MKIYRSESEAIIGLHERGYDQDFQLFGGDLLWLQGKIFIRGHEFSIPEFHFFPGIEMDDKGIFIFAINCHMQQIRGIMLVHEEDYRLESTALSDKVKECWETAGKKKMNWPGGLKIAKTLQIG